MKVDVRKTQLIISNFLIQTKQSKREIIFWAIITFVITFLLSHYIIEPGINYIDDQFSPKPNILSNVIALNGLDFSSSNAIMENGSWYNTTMENVSVYLNLGDYSTTLIFVYDAEKISETDFNEVEFFTPNQDLCPYCTIYNFLIKNIGNKRADKVIIDIKASSVPELIFDSPKMIRKECGGHLDQKGCYIIVENINEGEKVSFALFTKELSNLVITSCTVDGKYSCEFRLLRTKTLIINPKTDMLILNNKKVNLPILETPSSKKRFYYFNLSQFKFIERESLSESWQRR